MTNVISKLNGKHIDIVGVERHFLNDLLHREDGPAIEYSDGDKAWYLNGVRHREDGPAIEYADGSKVWYFQDQHIDCKDNQEFLKIVKLIVFY